MMAGENCGPMGTGEGIMHPSPREWVATECLIRNFVYKNMTAGGSGMADAFAACCIFNSYPGAVSTLPDTLYQRAIRSL